MTLSANMVKEDFIFFQPDYDTHQILSEKVIEKEHKLSFPYAQVNIKEWYFEGIRILFSNYHYNDSYTFLKINNINVVHLDFNLKGTYRIYHNGNIYEPKSRQHNIIYTPGTNNNFKNAENEGATFSIQIAPELFLKLTRQGNEALQRFGESVMRGEPVVISKESLFITPKLQQAITDIIECKYTGLLKKIYLWSKCMEILVLQAESYNEVISSKSFQKVNDYEMKCLLMAKEYLDQHYQDPPTLQELSRLCGVNEYKLKKGFKQVFNTTVFQYLTDFRLDKAADILSDNQKNIAEVAYELGYYSPQHFSLAFRKKFGYPPGKIKK